MDTTCAKQNQMTPPYMKRFGSPLDLIRDVDDLLHHQMFSELDDYSYRPRLFENLADRQFLERFRPRFVGSDTPSGLRLASPWYEITEGESEFKLAVDVPGVKAADMKIKLEQDGRVLRLTGERMIKDGNWTSEIRFEKAFLLDKKIQADKITANLSDGVIVITAPKVLPAIEQKKEIDIPITEFDHAAISDGEKRKDGIYISRNK